MHFKKIWLEYLYILKMTFVIKCFHSNFITIFWNIIKCYDLIILISKSCCIVMKHFSYTIRNLFRKLISKPNIESSAYYYWWSWTICMNRFICYQGWRCLVSPYSYSDVSKWISLIENMLEWVPNTFLHIMWIRESNNKRNILFVHGCKIIIESSKFRCSDLVRISWIRNETQMVVEFFTRLKYELFELNEIGFISMNNRSERVESIWFLK